MNRDETKAAAEVMLAWANGAAIQVRNRYGHHTEWRELPRADRAKWAWGDFEYRIKPEPRELWVSSINGFVATSRPTDFGEMYVHYREVIE